MNTGCQLPGLIPYQFEFCYFDRNQKVNLLLVGDSKGQALFPGLVDTAKSDQHWAFVGGVLENALLPTSTNHPFYGQFQNNLNKLISAVDIDPGIKVVVFANAANSIFALNQAQVSSLTSSKLALFPNAEFRELVFSSMQNTVDRLLKKNKKIVFVLDNPTFPDLQDCLNRKSSIGFLNQILKLNPNPLCIKMMSEELNLMAPYREVMFKLADRYPKQVYIFDSLPYLCEPITEVCGTYMLSSDGQRKFIYSKTDHLSLYGATLVGRSLNQWLENTILNN